MARLLVLFIIVVILSFRASAQWVVTSKLDLPDEDLTDAIYAPKTLRSAIQNANKAGVATTIEIFPAIQLETIQIATGLPVCAVPTTFVGKGITLEPSVGSTATYGLWFTGNGSKIKDVQIKGFNGAGLVWQVDDGLIERMIIRDNNGPGINMNGAVRNVVGGEFRGYYSNYIYSQTGTGGHGISMILDSDLNTIQYTGIGITETYKSAGNSRSGIYSESADGLIQHNVISGNETDGISLDGRGKALNTVIEKNFIGTSESGNDTMPNHDNGIRVFDSSGETIKGNLVSGNKGNGIYISDRNSRFSVITNNVVGLNKSHNAALPNGVGIRLNGSNHFVATNIVSGNRGSGISTSARTTDIWDNIIGLDSTQKRIFGNGGSGIAANNLDSAIIGSVGMVAPNIIAGNGGAGISYIGSKAKGSIIVGNIIGSDADLKLVAPNSGSGVFVTHDVSDLFIEDNFIAYTGKHGVEIERNVVIFIDTTRKPFLQRPYDIHVRDNFIGFAETDMDSAGLIGGSGVSVLNADSIYIENNLIYACQADGITIANDSARVVKIYSNDIGTKEFTRTKRLIKGNGINIKGTSLVEIGAEIDPDSILHNRIHYCEGFAIRADYPTQAMDVFQNYTCGNVSGGIELDHAGFYYAFLSNDQLDRDADGANESQNTPDMAVASVTDGVGRIQGWMEGRPGTQYRFDVYLERLHPAIARNRTQGCIPVGSFIQNADFRGVVRIDRFWANDKVRAFGKDYPVITLTALGVEGTSQFSLTRVIDDPPEDTTGVDVAVYIDTVRSGVDVSGNAQLFATIVNLGFGVATNISVVDSLLGAFAVDSATIERGVTQIAVDKVTSTLTSLGIGESVEYRAYGRATKLGTNRRAIVAIPADLDLRPRNNHDTINMSVNTINSVAGSNDLNHRIESRDGRIRVTSLIGGVDVSVEDITGRTIGIGEGESFELRCVPGVYLVRVVGPANAISHQLVLVE